MDEEHQYYEEEEESDQASQASEMVEEPGDETLIHSVSYRPIIFDLSDKNFRNIRMTANTWDAVAAETGMTGKEIQLLPLLHYFHCSNVNEGNM